MKMHFLTNWCLKINHSNVDHCMNVEACADVIVITGDVARSSKRIAQEKRVDWGVRSSIKRPEIYEIIANAEDSTHLYVEQSSTQEGNFGGKDG